MQNAVAARNPQIIDPRALVRLSLAMVTAAALVWSAMYGSFFAPFAVDEMAFENAAVQAAAPLAD